MEFIFQSKIFKGTSNKAKILAAVNNPINVELVQQLESYVDGHLYEDEQKDDKPLEKSESESSNESLGEDKSDIAPRPSKHFGGGSSNSFKGSPSEVGQELEGEGESDLEIDESSDSDKNEEDNKDADVSSSTAVNASTYITVNDVANAVSELPGMLNLNDTTSGVTHVKLKGGSENEIWIYFNSDKDINQVIEPSAKLIKNSGYYFLEFSRVDRDSNAIVFSINWISNYFDAYKLIAESD